MHPTIFLKPGREKPLRRYHPWVFSGAVSRVEGNPALGDIVLIRSSGGEVLGYGGFSPHSQIRCRIWEFGPGFPNDLDVHLEDLISKRIRESIKRRRQDLSLNQTNAYRLVHAESDRLPGLIIDNYANVLVVQFLSCNIEPWQELVIQTLIDTLTPSAIYERSDAEVRNLEGLPERAGLLYGEIEETGLIIKENSVKLQIEVEAGHKTGFYLDQRDNRKLIRGFSNGKDVLDCFCYSGGFTLNALLSGAKRVTAVDQSSDALYLLARNLEFNNIDENRVERINDDVFQQLRKFRDQGRTFDLIILDPPKFAPTRSQAQKAARGYKDINLLAAKLLVPGGNLFTFSCSGGVDAHLFQQIVAGAAVDANADLQVIAKLSQASDHPVLLSFPEGEYLKGLVCRRLG